MLNSIEDALIDFDKGRPIIVVDDENRENEGDFVVSAEKISAETVNFMAMHGRGLICTPLSLEYAKRLNLAPMVSENKDSFQTAFTVSVDAVYNVTTGISAMDRAMTIKFLSHPFSTASDFNRPGHIFPLVAKEGGVLERPGHTEAAVDLAKLVGHTPVGVICEILNEDGSCARLPELIKVAQRFDLKIISIEDLIEYKTNLNISPGVENENNRRNTYS